MSVDLAERLYKTAIHKGFSIPFNPSLGDLRDAEVAIQHDPLVDEVVESIPWTLRSSQTYSESLHVNLREMDEACKLVKGRPSL